MENSYQKPKIEKRSVTLSLFCASKIIQSPKIQKLSSKLPSHAKDASIFVLRQQAHQLF